jgi:amidase
MRRWILRLLLAAIVPLAGATAAPVPVEERSIDQLATMMAHGTSSATIVDAYLARIAAMDRTGPALHAIIALNPNARAEARASDVRRRAGRPLGPLDGVPILVKDNIETRDQIATTAGSLALKDNVTRRDAPVVAALRRAGAVILGKTNLSEWANIRSSRSMSGWSAVGGLVRNPYALDRTACGSSSGSGAAVAASFAAGAIGTETDGSVVCPSSMMGLVGMKPTVGLVSRTHVVPISHSQDTPGPMARSVRDTALLLGAMVASDRADPATREADRRRVDYAAGLSLEGLKGVRVAVMRPEMSPALTVRFEAALAVLQAAGATLVDVTRPEAKGIGDAETLVLHSELKADLNAYLAKTPATVKARTLDALIAFNTVEADPELKWFGQETFEAAAATNGLDDPDYRAALASYRREAGPGGIDMMLKAGNATILVTPSYDAAWPSDPVHGDQSDGPSASQLPAIAGYPHLTVPMGQIQGLPVGLSFIATAFADAAVLRAGYAYEQASHLRVPPTYRPKVVGP